ncbi:MAG: hypothetical protein NW237_01960 [Cyanobacteriota bacterium]|nr:hypothetical protein [Cyanobacteriota bacterium]
MIEVEVHQQLRQLLRQSPDAVWPHQLTMARLVARGLRLGRNALIQVPEGDHHRLSYLLPALMWSGATLLCVSEAVQAQILRVEIPWLQEALQLNKPVLQSSVWPGDDFQGLWVMDPLTWLRHRLTAEGIPIPSHIPLILDQAEHLETWLHTVLTLTLTASDWHRLQRAVPLLSETIGDTQIRLTVALLQRPLAEFLLHEEELKLLKDFLWELRPFAGDHWPSVWLTLQQRLGDPCFCWWARVDRQTGQVTLLSSPLAFSALLSSLWLSQPFVMMGESLDLDRNALSFRQRFGLPDLTSLRFPSALAADLAQPPLTLYTPPLPPPNTPQFRDQVISELKQLICQIEGSSVVLVSDQPLQTQIAASLAAEFGSRVRLNLPHAVERGILVCDWDYWLTQRESLPIPQLLGIATLPFPSMEDPLVAGRVEHMRQQRQDWFRTYLLPTAASKLQRAIAPLRSPRSSSQLRDEGSLPQLAILDSRILYRSYGHHLLAALGPLVQVRHRHRLP